MLFRFQARNQPSKFAQEFNQIWVEFWVAILARPGCLLDAACAFFADVVQVSSQNSAAKTRRTIQPNLVEFWMTVLAGPARFLDSACAFLVEVAQVSSQKSAFKFRTPAREADFHCPTFLLMLFRFQARNQPSKFAQQPVKRIFIAQRSLRREGPNPNFRSRLFTQLT